MLQLRKKKGGESIYRFKSAIILSALLLVQVVITLTCLSCFTFLPYKVSSLYAAELPFFEDVRPVETALTSEEKKRTIKRSLEKAKSHYRNGRYSEAISIWNEVLSVDPANRKAQKGVIQAEKKIAKLKDFFGRDIFRDFKDTGRFSLKECIKIAEETSLPLQIAREYVNLNKIKVWEARRSFLPSLTLSWTETKGIQSGGKTESIEYGLEGKQPAFHSGELLYTLAQAKTNMAIAEENYDKVKMEQYFEVAEAYYMFVKAKKFLEYTKELYVKVKPLYEMSQKKYDRRVVPDIEYLDTESKFNQIYYKSISAESDYKLARLALAQKLNIENAEDIDVILDNTQRTVDKDINACLSLAMENRPDLKMNELTVKSTEYGRKIAYAKEMPTVDITANYKKASEAYRRSYAITSQEQSLDPRRKWYAGLEVAWPFLGSTGSYSLYKRKDPPTLTTFDPGSQSKGTTWKLGILDNVKQFSETKEAEITHVRAEEELNDMRKKVVMEVKEAFHGYEKARVQLEAADIQKEFRGKEIKILEAKHSLGDVELSDVFESLVRLMEANEAYFEAEQSLYTTIAALNKATGMEEYF